MKLKKTIILTILLLAILAVGAASAADDNATSETLKLSEDSSESVLSEEIIFSVGNFAQLKNDTDSGNLNSSYEYNNKNDSIYKSGINISTGKHINGNGNTIDARNNASIFNINANGTVLENIIFKNGANSAIRINDYCTIINCTFINCSGPDGGAISVDPYGSCNIVGCTFINCSANATGGAISIEGEYSSVSNSYFENCSANLGGAIYWNGNEGNLQNSVFTRSKAKNGGAVYWAGKNGLIKDSTFNNTSANSTEDNSGGGAIYWTGENGTVTDCTFTNTSVNSTGKDSGGGAIYWTGENAKVTNSRFNNTNANGTNLYGISGGGAIYMHKNNTGIISNCTFNNSTSEGWGGAIYAARDLFIISESYFINCFAINGGAVVVSDSSTTGSITNSYFINCSAGSLGGAIYWEGDNGNVTDSAFINTKGHMGGAICWDGDNGKVIGSLFLNTTNDWQAGAIFWRGSNGNVTHSKFYNTNSSMGGAIYWEGTDGSIQYSTFISSKAGIGGAVYSEAQDTLITFSHFENNTDDGEGSAVYLGIVSNCTFVGNTPPTLYPKTILNTTITATNSTCYIGGEIEIKLNITTIDNNPFEAGADLYINGQFNKTIPKNTQQFTFTPKEAGEYRLQIKINATDDNYASESNVLNITSIQKDPAMTVSCASITYGDEASIIVTLKNDTTGNITFEIDNRTYSCKVNDGSCNLNINGLNAGTYNVTVTYSGDAVYKNATCHDTLTVQKAEASILTDPINSTYYGEDVIITVILPNDATGTVTAIVDGKNYNANINNGKATFNLTNMNPGTYDATVSYPGDNNYLAAQNTTSFTVKSSKKTFADITSLINSASAGDVINLAGTYYGSGSIINVNKAVSIVGSQNTVLDAGGLSGIMTVSSNNVKISNIKFVNGRLNSNGGAINWIGSNGILSNCTFENCSANNGGAVYWNSNDGQILNSKFINSRAKSGGAVYVSGNNEVVAASSIFKNNAEILNAPAYGSKLSNCIFEDCSADNGGSVYWNAKNGVIEETSFDSSKASANGGAVYWNSNDGQILDSEFTNSRAKNGGAVYVSGNNEVVVVSSIFENNNAEVLNGAVYGGKTKLCSFKNNTDSQINTRTILSLNETAIYIGNSISITTLVLNQQKGGLARGTVNLFINSKLVAAIDANDGFIFTPSEIGIYEVTAVFNENSEHHNSSDTATFSAIPIEIPEEISTSTEGVFTLEFPDDAEGTLTVFIDGTRYQVYNIVGGILNIDLTQFKGKHVITFEYGGDKNYPAFTKDVNVTVQTNPSISARNVNVQYLANQKYTIKVFKNKGIPAASTWVVIKLNNKAFKKLKTNKNGIVTFVVNQKPGTYKLKITSLRKTVQRTVKVKHVVTLKSTTLKKSARKLTLQATLAKVKGKYLIKKTITFRINGKKVATAKTNKRGIAKITIRNPTWLKKLKVGKKVTYQATYLKDTVKRTTKMRK